MKCPHRPYPESVDLMSLSVQCQQNTLVDVVACHYVQSAEPICAQKGREEKGRGGERAFRFIS
jgi:hypothetical protein